MYDFTSNIRWNENLIWDFYLAGPLFSEPERTQNSDIQKALHVLGYKVYLPQLVMQENVKAIFQTHVENLALCAGMIAICDGSDVDSGTAWEIGKFSGHNRPIIGLRTDFRMSGDDGAAGVNLMISQSINHQFNNADYMIQWIFKNIPIIGVKEEEIDYTP